MTKSKQRSADGPQKLDPDRPGARPSVPPPLAADDFSMWGCMAAIVCGIGITVFAIWLLFTGKAPIPLRVALLLVGVSNTVLGVKALQGSRVAWAFVTATCGTLALICLFGAPKIRDTTGYSLAASALPFLVFLIITTLLAFRHDTLER